MNFGQNAFDWFIGNAQPLVLMAVAVIGLYLAFKREYTKLIGFLIIGIVAIGLVFNTVGAKDAMLNLFNRVVVNGACRLPVVTSFPFCGFVGWM